MADDHVRVRAGARDSHLSGARAEVQTSVAELRRVRAVRVVLGVGEAGLDLGHHVAGIRLGRGVLTLRTLAEERRKGDRGQDADDQDYNEELNKGETLLLAVDSVLELGKQDGRVLSDLGVGYIQVPTDIGHVRSKL